MSTVWIATEQYPESTVVLVAENEAAILREIVAFIGRDEYEEFASSLEGDEATTVTFDDDPIDVLRIWAGEKDPDGAGGGYFIGSDWLVIEREVAR